MSTPSRPRNPSTNIFLGHPGDGTSTSSTSISSRNASTSDTSSAKCTLRRIRICINWHVIDSRPLGEPSGKDDGVDGRILLVGDTSLKSERFLTLTLFLSTRTLVKTRYHSYLAGNRFGNSHPSNCDPHSFEGHNIKKIRTQAKSCQ